MSGSVKLSNELTIKVNEFKKNRDMEGLEKYLLDLIDDDPNNFLVLIHLSSLYLNAKRYDEAEPFVKKSYELKPNHATVNLNYGKLMQFKFKDYDKAIEFYQFAIADDELLEAYKNLADIYLDIYNDVDKAYDVISAGLEEWSNHADFYAQLAYIQFYHRHNYEIAQSLLEKALSIDKNGRYLSYMGQINNHLGNTEEAYEYYQQALDMGELNQTLVLEFSLLLVMIYKDYEKAIDLLKQATDTFVDEAIYPSYLANLLANLYRLDEAQVYLKLAEKRPVKSQDELLLIGFLKAMLEKDTEDAMMYFEKVVEIDPKNLNALSIVGFYHLFNNEQIEQALNYFNKVIDLGAPFYPIYFLAAQIYKTYLENYTRALEIYLKIDASRLPSQEQSQLYFMIGELYVEGFNDRNEALNYFEKAYELHPSEQLKSFIEEFYHEDKTLIN